MEELKKKYYDSTKKLTLSQQIIRGKELELEKKMVECYYIQDEIKVCIDKLKKEALYPNVNETAEEYIDLQIESERSEKKAGYKDRIKTLESIKQNNKLINQMFKEGATYKVDLMYIITTQIIAGKKNQPTPDEWANACTYFARLDSESAAGKFLQSACAKWPDLNDEFGQVPGRDKYVKGIEILSDAYPRWASDETDIRWNDHK